MITDNEDLFSDLRLLPVDITLEQSLARAEAIDARRRRVRRIAIVIGILVVTGSALLTYLLNDDSTVTSVEHPPKPETVDQYHRNVLDPGPSASLPTELAVPASSSADPVLTPRPQARSMASFLAIVTADDAIRNELAIDVRSIETIRTIISPGDRVVAVDNLGKRETCINVTCAGGDMRNIVCTAPIPSPVRITLPSGGVLYDIDRLGLPQDRGPYVAVRTSGSRGDLILWYQVDKVLERILPEASKESSAQQTLHSWLQPDSTTVIEVPTGKRPWRSVTVHAPDGSALSIPVQWVDHSNGSTHVHLKMSSPATHEIRICRANGTTERFLHVVR
ncbi:MAG: hypothetical protein FGM33_01785 [Candidatus Kapabacteria bacterium]|nr:hypothetical protein [Candidatus Kapabacteria bacterium]